MKRFKTFVANRVSQIRCVSEPDQWLHIPGNQNPADVLSRGCSTDNVPEMWLHGPDFIWDYNCNWPNKSPNSDIYVDDLEVAKPDGFGESWGHIRVTRLIKLIVLNTAQLKLVSLWSKYSLVETHIS